MVGKRWHLEHIGQDELGVAMLRVFFQQFFQNCTGFGTKAVEKVLPLALQPLGPLATGTQRGVEGEVTEQVEGVRLRLTGDLGQLFEIHAPFG